jgi:signal transduction histidine kinase
MREAEASMRTRPLRSLPALRLLLPSRTVRSRLTLVYGGLFLISGAVLLVITGLLWERATDGQFRIGPNIPGAILRIAGWSSNAPKYRVAGSGFSATTVGTASGAVAKLQLVNGPLQTVAAEQRGSDLHQLLLYSVIALGVMAMFSIALGWLTAGRVLRPLRTITSAARRISVTNLHERLTLGGPDDELKELGNTIDELLGRLERSFQSQRQFVANASHELRTPLATMRASLDVAMAKPGPIPAQTISLANRLHQELDHIDGLLESFLALARAQRGPVDEDVALSLDLLVAAALEGRQVQIWDMGLQVREADCPEARVRGNETLLARMVENVIDNAVHHNEHNGWIRAGTEVNGQTARLIVENGGPVFDDNIVADLVQPFRRLGVERTGSDAGFGLGLSIVASIAETHGGHLELHPRSGGGIQVIIELPLATMALAGIPA